VVDANGNSVMVKLSKTQIAAAAGAKSPDGRRIPLRRLQNATVGGTRQRQRDFTTDAKGGNVEPLMNCCVEYVCRFALLLVNVASWGRDDPQS
jgi:hypothetical protein